MLVKVVCPNPACGKRGNVPAELLGQAFRCPACDVRFRAAADETLAGNAGDATFPRDQHDLAAIATSPLAIDPAPLPKKVGRFQIETLLGAGATGSVYRAYDAQLERLIALKVPLAATLESAKRVERFLREAKAAARLRHPAIVPIFEAGHDGQHYYIASAYVAGQTLAHVIRGGALEVRRAAEIARALADALAYAHEQKIIHRDVKPANVMIDEAGQPHLMDFGLAYRLEVLEKLTLDGAILGTPSYMAPEQAGGAAGEPKLAADQYSLGVLFYELLCGRTPFSGPPQVVLFNAVHTPPPRPRQLRPDVPRDLETICLKAMAKQPEDRYPTCRELADDLRRWLEREPIQARRPGLAERAARWCRREPALTAAAGMVFLCLLMVAGTLSVASVRLGDAAAQADAARRQAEKQKDHATQARQAAEAALAEARLAQEKAERAREAEATARRETELALVKFKEARAAEAEAQDRAEKLRLQAKEALVKADENFYLYREQIVKAEKAWSAYDVVAALRALEACPLKYRAWEWHFLHRRCTDFTVFPCDEQARILEVSPDGNCVAVGGSKTVNVLDLQSGKWLGPLPLSTVPTTIKRLVFVADHLKIPARKGIAALDLSDRGIRKQLLLAAVGFDISGGEQPLLAAPLYQVVEIIDLASGKTLFEVPFRDATRVKFSANGDLLAVANERATSREIELWDLKKKSVRFKARGGAITLNDSATHLAFDLQGLRVFDVAAEPNVRDPWLTIKDVRGPRTRLPHPPECTPAFLPRSNILTYLSSDGLRIVDVVSKKPLGCLPANTVTTYAVFPDGDRIVFADAEGPRLRVCSASPVPEAAMPHGNGRVVSLDFVKGDRELKIAAQKDHKSVMVQAWDVITKSKSGETLHERGPSGDLEPPLGKYARRIVYRPYNYAIHIRRESDKAEHVLGIKEDSRLEAMDFGPGDDEFTTVHAKGAVTIWSISARTRKFNLQLDGDDSEKIAGSGWRLSRGSIHLARISNRGRQVHFWDLTAGEKTPAIAPRTLALPPGKELLTGSFNADGRVFMVYPFDWLDTTIRLVRPDTASEIMSFSGTRQSKVAVDPGRARIAIAQDTILRIYDMERGKELISWAAHQEPIEAITFSSDGNRLASSDRSGFRIWDATPR